MTPSARASVREILGTLDEEKAKETAASLAQQTKDALHGEANDIDDDDDDDVSSSANRTDAQKDNEQSLQEPPLSSLGTGTRTHRTETKTNQTEEKPKKKKG